MIGQRKMLRPPKRTAHHAHGTPAMRNLHRPLLLSALAAAPLLISAPRAAAAPRTKGALAANPAGAPAAGGAPADPGEDADDTLMTMEEMQGRLKDLEHRIEQTQGLVIGRRPTVSIGGYVDMGFFAPQGNGSGIVRDTS